MFGFGKKHEPSERKKRVRSLLHDFTHLQIDTIVVEAIAGIGAPAPRVATVEIIEAYERKLLTLKRLGTHERLSAGSDFADTVAHLQLIAERAEDTSAPPPARNKDKHLLRRIAVNARNLVDMLQEMGAWPQAGDDSFGRANVKISRMWEIRTNPIVMQTVIGLDGDVVNRIDSDYVGADFAPLHEVHQRAVRTGLETWNTLIETVVKLVDAFTDRR
ncbi:MAG: hypothetical protein GKR94_11835 [Gammaproteobacteria bacterium]|nr:hypothetical protein [Gammaproteobacteria bacterium]